MRILGVDPGLTNCGWGIIEKIGNQYKLIASGCIVTSKILEDVDKLSEIYKELNKICVQYAINIISVEQVFFAKNAATALKTSEVIGICKLMSGNQKLGFKLVTPLQMKMALTGYGRAEKFQIENMVKRLLNVQEKITPSHAADGVAIALTAGFISRA